MVSVSTGCEYMAGSRCSGIVSCAYDVLEMSVMRGVSGLSGVCDMCLALGGR